MKRGEKDIFPEKLAENFWLLGNYYFSLYLVRGAHASALIETGISATCDAVIAQLEGLDIAPDYIVVTHPHSDHVTGLTGLCDHFPHVIPLIGQGAREFAAHPKALSAMIREDRFMTNGEATLRKILPGRICALQRRKYPRLHASSDSKVPCAVTSGDGARPGDK